MAKKMRLPTEAEIRAKAYQIYLARNCEHGHALDDWEQAEYELMQLPLSELAKLDATVVEKEIAQNHKLFDLTRATLNLKKQSSKQLHPYWNHSSVSSTAVMASAA